MANAGVRGRPIEPLVLSAQERTLCVLNTLSGFIEMIKSAKLARMVALICFVLAVLASPSKSNIRLEAENAVLRHQLIVLRRKLKGRALPHEQRPLVLRPALSLVPVNPPVLMIIRPETLVGWHRAGFRRYWRWKSCRRGGRPQIETELRALIRQMGARICFGVRRASTANCSSSGLASLNQVSPVYGQATRPSKSGMADLSASRPLSF